MKLRVVNNCVCLEVLWPLPEFIDPEDQQTSEDQDQDQTRFTETPHHWNKQLRRRTNSRDPKNFTSASKSEQTVRTVIGCFTANMNRTDVVTWRGEFRLVHLFSENHFSVSFCVFSFVLNSEVVKFVTKCISGFKLFDLRQSTCDRDRK